MIVGYIKKQNKPIELIDKIKYFFKIVKVTQCNMGYVLEIPFKGSTDKMINKVSKIIKKLEIDNIVFSNEFLLELLITWTRELHVMAENL